METTVSSTPHTPHTPHTTPTQPQPQPSKRGRKAIPRTDEERAIMRSIQNQRYYLRRRARMVPSLEGAE